ncbi:MAG TPA: hypothetical protein VM760_00420 [Sphingomicrobium sp.]|jgi:hypothetical protein|nr:hypothetical protein [Sphingomicrobium sp.]
MTIPHARRAEDTSAGCQVRAESDAELARQEPNDRMRTRLESSASVWAARATLLKRLEEGRARSAEA